MFVNVSDRQNLLCCLQSHLPRHSLQRLPGLAQAGLPSRGGTAQAVPASFCQQEAEHTPGRTVTGGEEAVAPAPCVLMDSPPQPEQGYVETSTCTPLVSQNILYISWYHRPQHDDVFARCAAVRICMHGCNAYITALQSSLACKGATRWLCTLLHPLLLLLSTCIHDMHPQVAARSAAPITVRCCLRVVHDLEAGWHGRPKGKVKDGGTTNATSRYTKACYGHVLLIVFRADS